MSVLGWATIAVFAVLIGALAVSLLVVIVLLWRTSAALTEVVGSLAQVADRTAPLGAFIAETNEALAPANNAMVEAAPIREGPRGRRLRPRSRAVS